MHKNEPEVEIIDVEAVTIFFAVLSFVISLILDWLGYAEVSEILAKIAVYVFISGIIYVILYYLTAGIKSLFSKKSQNGK